MESFGAEPVPLPRRPVLCAGVLRLADSLQIGLPLGHGASTSGLWVGEATVSQVRHYLKTYARDGAGQPITVPSPADNPTTAPYQVTATDTSFGPTARSVPLRLILHHDSSAQGGTRLLQRVYHDLRFGTDVVLATRESLLDPTRLEAARRISAATFRFPGVSVAQIEELGSIILSLMSTLLPTTSDPTLSSTPLIGSR